MTDILQHPQLGRVAGKKSIDAVQFLGLQYATLADRFSEAKLKDYTPGKGIDATKLGPFPISSAEALQLEAGFLQKSLPESHVPEMSGLEGLTLNISVPLINNALDTTRSLPVLLFIHGGAYLFGSSWYPHYSQDDFVALSAQQGRSVIAVSINYRLGLPGLLTSEDFRSAGYKANNSLRDQKMALRWIKKYIAGFGGDPSAITAIGQSAGAMSVCYHLQSEEPLFEQAILLGGSTIILPPGDLGSAERLYHDVITKLGLTDLSPSVRIAALKQIPDQGLIALATPDAGWNIVVDDDVVCEAATFGSVQNKSDTVLPGKKWCARLLAVQGNLESSIVGFLALNHRKANISKAFRDSF